MPIKFGQIHFNLLQPNLGKINQNWNKLGQNLCHRQTTFGICVQRTCLRSMNSPILNALKRVLPWQQILEYISKSCTYFSYVHKYINLRFIKVTLLMLKNSKNQCKNLSV